MEHKEYYWEDYLWVICKLGWLACLFYVGYSVTGNVVEYAEKFNEMHQDIKFIKSHLNK